MASILEHETRTVAAVEQPWVRYAVPLAVAIAVLGILAVHADTVASIVSIWNRSETFAHGYVVAPIALWLAWRQRARLRATLAKPSKIALLGVALAGAMWLVMSIAEVTSPRQFALVFMLQAAVVAVAGTAIARVAALPILFLLFAVPAGEFLLPTLIDRTADFTVLAVRLSGVPVFREANHFVIPSGAWSVVEACSGLRYLIASMMIGVVYASVTYHATWRRVAFIGASIAVPLVANWLRAYMIVMIGHLSNNRLAVGVDHLIYGWLFFGVVMALLFWIGSFWSETAAEPAPERAVGGMREPAASTPPSRFYAAAFAAIALAALWRPVLAALDDDHIVGPPRLAAVDAAGGFVPADSTLPLWTPAYTGHSGTLRETFSNNGDEAVLYIAYYRNQAKTRELITSANQLVTTKELSWKEVARAPIGVTSGDISTTAMRSVLSGSRERLVVYRLFWINDHLASDEYVAKAWLAWSKLRGRGDDAALIVFYARETETRDVAREATQALLPQVVRMLAATRDAR